MAEVVQLKVSRFVQALWLAWGAVAAAFAVNSLFATLRLAAEPGARALERAAPLIAIALLSYVAWFFWWRVVPEFRPMGELRVQGDDLVVDAPPFLREPLRVSREYVRAGVIDQPQPRNARFAASTLSAATIGAESSEGFGISALVLHSSWPNLVLFFEPPVELPRRRLRARLLFPRRVTALLAQVADPAQAASAFAAWNLPQPERSEVSTRRLPRRTRTARGAKFSFLGLSAGGSFAALATLSGLTGSCELSRYSVIGWRSASYRGTTKRRQERPNRSSATVHAHGVPPPVPPRAA